MNSSLARSALAQARGLVRIAPRCGRSVVSRAVPAMATTSPLAPNTGAKM
jgi:hypothetical protein